MRHIYADVEHWATINLINLSAFVNSFPQWKNVHCIQGVEVQSAFRNQGFGSKLMLEVLADANAEDVTLILHVTTHTEEHRGGLDYDGLIRWYSGMGFKLDEESLGEGGMVRMPRKLKPARKNA